MQHFSKGKDDFIIPECLFDERKLIILRLPFPESIEKITKSVLRKLIIFTNNKFKFRRDITDTRDIRSLF